MGKFSWDYRYRRIVYTVYSRYVYCILYNIDFYNGKSLKEYQLVPQRRPMRGQTWVNLTF